MRSGITPPGRQRAAARVLRSRVERGLEQAARASAPGLVVASGGTSSGSPMTSATRLNGFGICVRSQLCSSQMRGRPRCGHGRSGAPVALGEPDGAGLGHARRAARAVERERRRSARPGRPAISCSMAARALRELDPRAVP